MVVLSMVSFAGLAKAERQYKGKYVPSKGWAKTVETAHLERGDTPKQQGGFRLVLVHENWEELTEEEKATTYQRINMSGVLTGTVSLQTGKAAHVFVNKSRSGVMYSADDTLIPTAGDFLCFTGVPLTGVEEIKLIEGTGEYSGLVGGSIFVDGVVNMCPWHEDYRKNTFVVVPDQGYIEFN